MPALAAGCLGPISGGRGTLFPQPMANGAGWTTLLAADFKPTNQQMLVEQDRVATDWFLRHNATAAILRPDNYVFSTASSETDLSNSLASLARALT